MVEIGKYNKLTISKERSVGFFFDGGDDGDILMPKRHQPEHCAVGDELEVFVFLDSDERLTATVRKPFAQVGEIALLKVVDTHKIGAFLDWGMTKDLLVPMREQNEEMLVGKSYLVRLLLDNDRIIGSARLDKFVSETAPKGIKAGKEVDLLIAQRTPQGYRAIVNQSFWGLLYDSEIFQKLQIGQRVRGFVSKLREDGKVDLSLQKPGYSLNEAEVLGKKIMTRIKADGGKMALTDKSPPEAIHEAFGVSKKAFKQAVGKLYKERRIVLEPDGIKMAKKV